MIDIQNPLLRDVGVDLRRGQIAMAEQFLHAAEVGPAIQQMGGEAVPQGVRAGRVDQAGTQQLPLQQAAHAPRRQPAPRAGSGTWRSSRRSSAAAAGPTGRAIPTPSRRSDRAARVGPCRGPGPAPVSHRVVQVQAHQLARPASRRRRVSRASPGRGPPAPFDRHRVQQPDHLVDAKQSRQPPGLLGVAKAGRRVGADQSLPAQETENERKLASRRATVLGAYPRPVSQAE